VFIEFEYLDHLHDSRFPPGTLGAQISFITQVLENLVDCVETSVINGGLHFGDISEGVDPEGDMGTQQWLDLFRPFTAAEHLIVGENVVPAVARVLRGLPEGMAAEVLPALCRLTFETRLDRIFKGSHRTVSHCARTLRSLCLSSNGSPSERRRFFSIGNLPAPTLESASTRPPLCCLIRLRP
jgi:hypothetical protein